MQKKFIPLSKEIDFFLIGMKKLLPTINDDDPKMFNLKLIEIGKELYKELDKNYTFNDIEEQLNKNFPMDKIKQKYFSLQITNGLDEIMDAAKNLEKEKSIAKYMKLIQMSTIGADMKWKEQYCEEHSEDLSDV